MTELHSENSREADSKYHGTFHFGLCHQVGSSIENAVEALLRRGNSSQEKQIQFSTVMLSYPLLC
jgi:hypothetical protein